MIRPILNARLDGASTIPATGTLTAASGSTVDLSLATVTLPASITSTFFDFKGNQSASGNPNYPTGSKGDVYYISVAGKVGGASGKTVTVGDMLICSADNAGGTEASVGTSWFVTESNLDMTNVAITGGSITGTSITATSPTFATSVVTADASFTAFAGATTLLTIGGTGASASLFAPSTLDTTSSTTGAIRTSGGISAAKALNIGTTGTFGGQIITIAGAVGTPSIAPTDDSNTGIWFPAADTAAVSVAGARAITIGVGGTGGRVGVNSTAPGATFHVVADSAIGGMAMRLSDTTNAQHADFYAPTSDGTNTAAAFGTASNHNFAVFANNSGWRYLFRTTGIFEIVQSSGGKGGLGITIPAGGTLAAVTTGKANVGGVLKDFYTDVGNVTTGEDDLYTYTTLANTLATDGHKLEAEFSGIFVSAATETLQLKAYFGGTQIFATGALTITADCAWLMRIVGIRVSASVVRFSVWCGAQVATDVPPIYTEVTGLTLSSTNILKITGEAAGAGAVTNHIIAKLGNIKWMPAGT